MNLDIVEPSFNHLICKHLKITLFNETNERKY